MLLTLQTEVFEVVDPLHGHHLAHPEAVLQRAAVVVGEPTLMGWIQHLCLSSNLKLEVLEVLKISHMCNLEQSRKQGEDSNKH